MQHSVVLFSIEDHQNRYCDQRNILLQKVSGYLPDADVDAPTQLKNLLPDRLFSISNALVPRHSPGCGHFLVFFGGIAFAGVLSGLFSGSIICDMGGIMGKFRWQWMFVIEDAPAACAPHGKPFGRHSIPPRCFFSSSACSLSRKPGNLQSMPHDAYKNPGAIRNRR